MKLEGAVIAVTGGASGLGAGATKLCLERGAKVAVLDMNKALKASIFFMSLSLFSLSFML